MDAPANANLDLARPRAHLRTVRITPDRGRWDAQVADCWDFRELVATLVVRDIKVRYKQTVAGLAWTILQPVATMLVFTVVFSKIARIPSDGLPYPIFLYSAMILWTYFSAAFSAATGAIVDAQQLITKVYFPRVLLIVAAVVPQLLDLAISLAVFVVLLFIFRTPVALTIVLFPLFVAFVVALAIGGGLALSTVHARYRDVRTVAGFGLQLLLYATPVVYSSNRVPAGWMRVLYRLNPIAAAVEGSRWSLTGHGPAPDVSTAGAVGLTALVVVVGWIHFNRTVGTVADVV